MASGRVSDDDDRQGYPELTPERMDHCAQLAEEALLAAAKHYDADTAIAYIRRIGGQFGPDGHALMLQVWVDLMLAVVTPPGATRADLTLDPETGLIPMLPVRVGPGATGEPPAPPPEVAWAQRWITARATMNRGAAEAALDELPAQSEPYIAAVLKGAVLAIGYKTGRLTR